MAAFGISPAFSDHSHRISPDVARPPKHAFSSSTAGTPSDPGRKRAITTGADIAHTGFPAQRRLNVTIPIQTTSHLRDLDYNADLERGQVLMIKKSVLYATPNRPASSVVQPMKTPIYVVRAIQVLNHHLMTQAMNQETFDKVARPEDVVREWAVGGVLSTFNTEFVSRIGQRQVLLDRLDVRHAFNMWPNASKGMDHIGLMFYFKRLKPREPFVLYKNRNTEAIHPKFAYCTQVLPISCRNKYPDRKVTTTKIDFPDGSHESVRNFYCPVGVVVVGPAQREDMGMYDPSRTTCHDLLHQPNEKSAYNATFLVSRPQVYAIFAPQ